MLQKALGCLFVFGIAPVGIGGLRRKEFEPVSGRFFE